MSHPLYARPALPIEQYQVGWICPLSKELTAARAILDEEHEPHRNLALYDSNNYVLGRCCGHNVVIACLPLGKYGTNSAATVASKMRMTFTGILFGLVIGIGGGIPNLSKGVDIRLGDVVVSQPDGTHGGVVQYDLRKSLGRGKFERKGSLSPPPTLLLNALANLQSQHHLYGNRIIKTLSATSQRFPRLAKQGYVHPGLEKDVLHCENVHDQTVGGEEKASCNQCQNRIVIRKPRENDSPEIHYGIIVSGNELMKNAAVRDQLGQEFDAKCIEMEAAGLMDDFPCVVIRGICDYADSHKNDAWQEYAALAAAGFAKELMATIRNVFVRGYGHNHSRNNFLLSDESSLMAATIHNTNTMANTNTTSQTLLAKLDFANSDSKRAQLSLHEIGPECFRWIEDTNFFTWLGASDSPAFLVVGKPASGKSTLMRYLSDDKKVRDKLCSNGQPWTVVHYFFDFRGGSSPANDPAGMIRLFIRQLIKFGELKGLLDNQATIQRLITSDIRQCIDIFSDLMSGSRTQICAFVDGLDEYQGSLWELCKNLEILRHRTGIKMCVASRPEPEVLKACKDWPSLVMQDHNKQSMHLYIERRIDQVTTFEPEFEECFTQSLRKQLVDKAEGVILWVKLALEELLQLCGDQVTVDDLTERLASLEPDLDMLYERMLDKVPQHLRHDAALTLMFISDPAMWNSRWADRGALLLQAIGFIHRDQGFSKFLGGNFEVRNMAKRIVIFMPNLIEITGDQGFRSGHRNRIKIRLIHLSLATYLRKSHWLLAHLQPGLREQYFGDVWRLSMIKLLTVASIKEAIDVTGVHNRWTTVEVVNAQRRIGEHYKMDQPTWDEDDIPAEESGDMDAILPSWRPFGELLYDGVHVAPEIFIPSDDFIPHEVYECAREGLNLSCISWHIPKCVHRCKRALESRRTLVSLQHLMEERKLDVALAVMHRMTRYVEASIIGSRALSLEDLEKLLDLALCTTYYARSREITRYTTLNALCEGIHSRRKALAPDAVAPSSTEIWLAAVEKNRQEDNTMEYAELLNRTAIMAIRPSPPLGSFSNHCGLCSLVDDVERGHVHQHETFDPAGVYRLDEIESQPPSLLERMDEFAH